MKYLAVISFFSYFLKKYTTLCIPKEPKISPRMPQELLFFHF